MERAHDGTNTLTQIARCAPQVNSILDENGLTFDSEALDIVFKKFDVDGSGTMDSILFRWPQT